MGSNLVITKEIENYINNHSLELTAIQKEIISYNNSLGDIKRMQISISQCHFLYLIVKISNIKKILEIGTFTGLSGLTMSLSLPKDGELITLDKNAERNKIASNFFKKAGQENKIKTIIGPALESINNLKKKEQKFDLVFIDADKENYKSYYNQSLDLIEKNGLIIVDNVLWHGEVADTNKIASDFFIKAKQKNKIETIIGRARENLNDTQNRGQKFDLVFIDADKENYKNYYNQSLDLIEKNGLIIVDNVLWHGEVTDTKNQDKLTTVIREFNSYINKDKRTENLIIPVGDGLAVCRKL